MVTRTDQKNVHKDEHLPSGRISNKKSETAFIKLPKGGAAGVALLR